MHLMKMSRGMLRADGSNGKWATWHTCGVTQKIDGAIEDSSDDIRGIMSTAVVVMGYGEQSDLSLFATVR